jgi:hypothetical protein
LLQRDLTTVTQVLDQREQNGRSVQIFYLQKGPIPAQRRHQIRASASHPNYR